MNVVRASSRTAALRDMAAVDHVVRKVRTGATSLFILVSRPA
jgi:hypothetical protein